MRNQKYRILIADDDKNFRLILADIVRDLGYSADAAVDGIDTLEKLAGADYDLLLLDLSMPRMGGMEVLERLTSRNNPPEVIIVTSHASIHLAVKATKAGAYDFVAREEIEERLPLSIRNALGNRHLKSENIDLRNQLQPPDEMLGESRPLQNLREQIGKIAPNDCTVLICGESGSGKELVAREIYRQSRLHKRPLVTVNCSALPESLLESELFGHVKGAFTNATSAKKGKFEIADGGTIFLDEIGDMSLPAQAKVLRVLESGDIEKVGAVQPNRVAVRVLAATNKNLNKEIENQQFRDDLYYRLNVITVRVPALREHPEDIPLLAQHFLTRYSRQSLTPEKSFDANALAELQRHPWPGNIRELRNLMQRIAIMSSSEVIDPWELHQWWEQSHFREILPAPVAPDLPMDEARRYFEIHYIQQILQKCDGNITQTAKILQLNRSYLHEKLNELGIQR